MPKLSFSRQLLSEFLKATCNIIILMLVRFRATFSLILFLCNFMRPKTSDKLSVNIENVYYTIINLMCIPIVHV